MDRSRKQNLPGTSTLTLNEYRYIPRRQAMVHRDMLASSCRSPCTMAEARRVRWHTLDPVCWSDSSTLCPKRGELPRREARRGFGLP